MGTTKSIIMLLLLLVFGTYKVFGFGPEVLIILWFYIRTMMGVFLIIVIDSPLFFGMATLKLL